MRNRFLKAIICSVLTLYIVGCGNKSNSVTVDELEKDNAKLGEVDSLIRDVAKSELALLLTSDRIQAKTAEAQGIPVIYSAQEFKGNIELKIEKFFDSETMSVHLKENVPPMAKKGKPGEVRLVKLADEVFNYKQLENIAEEILEWN